MLGPNPQISGPGPRTSGFFNPWTGGERLSRDGPQART